MDKTKPTTTPRTRRKAVATPAVLPATPTTLVPSKPVALAPQPAYDMSPLAVMERLAKDPAVDVAKLQALVELQKDINREKAKAAFNAAFAEMQPKLPAITKRGKVYKKGSTTEVRNHFARLGEDIQPVIMPILGAHGFSLRHRTEWPADKPGIIRVVGVLSHSGHSEESVFEAKCDTSDYRTEIQSMGSTVSYGRRYTTIDLLNLTQQGVDDDGQSANRKAPKAPQREPDVAHNPDGDKPITTGTAERPGQWERMWMRVRDVGRSKTEVAMWLTAQFQVKDSKEIKRKDYDYIMACIEHPGPLPLTGPEGGGQ